MKEIVIANLSMDFALRIVNLYKYLRKGQMKRTGYIIEKLILTDVECESMMKDLRIIIGTLVNTIKKTKDNP